MNDNEVTIINNSNTRLIPGDVICLEDTIDGHKELHNLIYNQALEDVINNLPSVRRLSLKTIKRIIKELKK